MHSDFFDFVADESGENAPEEVGVGGNLNAHQRLFLLFLPLAPRPLLPLMTRKPLTMRVGLICDGRSRMRSNSLIVRSMSSSRKSGAAVRLRRTDSSATFAAMKSAS